MPQLQAWAAILGGRIAGAIATVGGHLRTFAVMIGNISQAHGLGALEAKLVVTTIRLGEAFGPNVAGLFNTFLGFVQGIPSFCTGTLLPAVQGVLAFLGPGFTQALTAVQGA